MTRHIIRRLLQAIPTIFGVTLLSYILLSFAPGDPIDQLLFGDPTISNETKEQLKTQLGLNDPWPIQYLSWLVGNDWMWWKNTGPDGEPRENRAISYGMIRGDFGESIKYKRPVAELIGERLPATIELGIAATIVALVIGLPIGVLAAITRGSLFDQTSRVLAVIGNALPNFWLGLLLFLFFGIFLDLDWARGGRCDKSVYRRIPCSEVPIYNRLEYFILPTIVLAYGGIAGYSRFMRTSMLDTVNSDYIRTARAKGLRSRTVWFQHAARNSLIPIATFLGPAIVGVIGGAVITEQIFSWPGLGLLFLDAISGRDYPIVMASVVLSSVLAITAYIISDILYALFDPRIRF